MNGVDARGVPVYGGYHGEFKKVHRATWEKVCENGVPQIFGSELEAETAAWRALRSHLQDDIVGTGEKASAARTAAEKMFGAIFKKGKRIPVELK